MINRFTKLFELNTSLPPGARQARVADLFPAMFQGTPLNLWRPADPVPVMGTRILLAVFTWSYAGMSLLDIAEARLIRRQTLDIKVDVLNLDDVKSMPELEQCFPKQAIMITTPIAGVWVDGRIIEMAFGSNTMTLFERIVPD